jgi:general secretion pathway protein I
MKPAASQRGFTLIEVLISLMIFAMMAIVLGSAYINVLNSYAIVGRGHEDDQDVSFARQELLTQPDFQTAENGDEFDSLSGNHIQWTATIDQAGATDLFTVVFTCQISPNLQAEPKTVTETFMLLRPTWSETAPNPTLSRSQMRANAALRIGQLQGTAQ